MENIELSAEEKSIIAVVQGHKAGIDFEPIANVILKKFSKPNYITKRKLQRLESLMIISHDGFKFFYTGKEILA